MHSGEYVVKSPAAGGALFFAPCSTKGRQLHHRRTADELPTGDARGVALLAELRASPSWQAALDGAVKLLDWSKGKAYYGDYLNRKRAVGMSYTQADGFKLMCTHEDGRQMQPLQLQPQHRGLRLPPGDFAFAPPG